MRIFIAEDEPLAAAKLKLFLEKAGEGMDITLFNDGTSLLSALEDTQKQNPELLFMDIQMPKLTGIDVLQRIGKLKFPVILTTAYDKYAIDGFNYGVADYLLKPYTLDRLNQALQKARMFLQMHDTPIEEALPENKSEDTFITIRCEGRNERILISDIEGLEAEKDYTRIHLSDGRRFTTLGTLTSFEQSLPPQDFVRIQRSYLVNLRKVQSYSTQGVRLQSGIEMPIGKTYRDNFLLLLDKANS